MSPMRILRRPHLRLLLLAGVAAALASVALGLTLVVRTNQAEQYRRSSSDTCMSVERLKGRIRETFQDARDRVARRSEIDDAQRAAVLAYYDRELARYAANECPEP